MANKRNEIKVPGSALSNAGLACLCAVYLGLMYGFLILHPILCRFFSLPQDNVWLEIVPFLLIFIALFFHIACSFYTVILSPDTVILKRFGITVDKIPASALQSFCAVGSGRDHALCLSCRSFEEISDLHEQKLLRGVFTKHDLPFRKRKPNWQDEFVREYLIRLRGNPFFIFRDKSTFMIEMHPAIQRAIQSMYPHLPYKNLTGITSPHVSRFSEIPENHIVCFAPQANPYILRMEPDGVHIAIKEKDFLFIPANQLKTAIRVDIFKSDSKLYPPHTPLLLLSKLSEEDLAKLPFSQGYSLLHLSETNDSSLLAMMSATYLALTWNKSKKDYCIIQHTQKNLETLQALYPHITVNDTPADWMHDSQLNHLDPNN